MRLKTPANDEEEEKAQMMKGIEKHLVKRIARVTHSNTSQTLRCAENTKPSEESTSRRPEDVGPRNIHDSIPRTAWHRHPERHNRRSIGTEQTNSSLTGQPQPQTQWLARQDGCGGCGGRSTASPFPTNVHQLPGTAHSPRFVSSLLAWFCDRRRYWTAEKISK